MVRWMRCVGWVRWVEWIARLVELFARRWVGVWMVGGQWVSTWVGIYTYIYI